MTPPVRACDYQILPCRKTKSFVSFRSHSFDLIPQLHRTHYYFWITQSCLVDVDYLWRRHHCSSPVTLISPARQSLVQSWLRDLRTPTPSHPQRNNAPEAIINRIPPSWRGLAYLSSFTFVLCSDQSGSRAEATSSSLHNRVDDNIAVPQFRS